MTSAPGEHPPLREALWADAKIYSGALMERPRFDTRVGFVREAARLAFESDAFLALACYRLRTALRARGVPLLPSLLARGSRLLARLDVDDGAVLEPGVYMAHGFVRIGPGTRVGRGTILAPFTELGPERAGEAGPRLDSQVMVGVGARIRGAVRVGLRSVVGANAEVASDVAPYTTVAGSPARLVRDRRDAPEFQALAEAIRNLQRARAAGAALHPGDAGTVAPTTAPRGE
ncbi:MAG: hypothetical protein FJ104_16765, partial [Deltaproteobacteria bacterium]|nr:hypothetical protein [Deltaproteobacteria bacterium]